MGGDRKGDAIWCKLSGSYNLRYLYRYLILTETAEHITFEVYCITVLYNCVYCVVNIKKNNIH